MNKVKIITRKIEVYINQPDLVKRKKEMETIKQWMLHSRNYANSIMSLLHSVKFLDKTNKTTNPETMDSLSEYLNTSKQNLGYKVFTEQYKDLLPSTIRGCINNNVYKKYNSSYKDVLSGKSSIPSFKQNYPLFIGTKSFRNLTINSFEFFSINFKFKFGRDKSNNREIVRRVLNNTYTMGDSSLIYNFDDKKLYILMVVKIPVVHQHLNEEKVMGVDLGIKHPAYVSINIDENFRQAIGTEESFLHGRLAIQKQRRVLQKNLKYTNGGRGRTKKMRKLDSLGTKERNYIKNQNHIISKEIVRLALLHNCYAINIEDLSKIGKTEKNKFILRNWSYFELQSMIKNKANEVGIIVNVIDAKYSSQRCSNCGHIHEGNRETQSEFACQECGFTANADFNASKNISIADTDQYKKQIKNYIKKVDEKVGELNF